MVSVTAHKRPMMASAGDLHGRAVPEWIGATPDTPVPEKVKLRVLLRYERRCHWTGVLIRPADDWDVDHVTALINGGENREANLAPILRGKAHKEKTAKDRQEADKVRRLREKHYGLRKPRAFRRFAPNIRQIDHERDPDT